MNKTCKLTVSCGVALFLSAAFAENVTRGLWKDNPEMWKTPAAYPVKVFDHGSVRAVMIAGEKYRGKETRFFAYYGLPEGASPDRKVPGIVLIHGGWGTAYDTWVKTWNARGYAAIAMDNCGACPPRDRAIGRLSHPHSGPDGWGGFGQVNDPLTDQWSYHAISTVIRSHSFLRSLPEVDSARIGVTGISWGGYLTACVAGIDDRFAFAAPVYGCAYLRDHSVWTEELTQPSMEGARWDELWDARNFLPKAKMPVLWCAGSNDHFFPLDSLQRGCDLLSHPPQLALRVRMVHAHAPHGDPKEIAAFADAIVRNGSPLVEILSVERKDDRTTVKWDAHGRLVKDAWLCYTTSTDPVWEKREFKTEPIPFSGSELSAAVPSEATVWYANLETDDGYVTSTRVFQREIAVDFTKATGPVKPVNGVGQPPILGLDGTNMFHYLSEAGIPYSRLHDVGGAFGKNVFVDIPNLFRNFDADETDPANYDFFYTDILMEGLVGSGVEPYFRLGVTIENAAGRGGKAYRIFPPKDYAKWARICEHVIRHYTEGWADGFRMKISHWEIWNEPENWDTIERNQMWKAPFEDYVRLYAVASRHLKTCFPHLKIGGYAGCGFYGASSSWADPGDSRIAFLMKSFTDFLSACRDRKLPLDFFSFHCYDDAAHAVRQIAHCRRTLDDYGFKETEMSLNEWLPPQRLGACGTAGQAAEIGAMLVALQSGAVDDAEIYDARATGGTYGPLFNPDTYKPRKAYYVFQAFNELRKLGRSVKVSGSAEETGGRGLWVTAATDGAGRKAVFIANTSTNAVAVPDFFGGRSVRARVVDADHDFTDVATPSSIAGQSVLLLTELPR